MTKIFELKQKQQELLDELYWTEQDDDTQSEIIKLQLAEIEGSVERKLSFLSDVLAEAIGLSQIATERRKIAQERLEKKEKQAKRAEEKLREFILSVMHDFEIKSVKGDLLNVSRYKRDAIVQTDDFDIDKLPSDCVKITKDIDKASINTIFKNGGFIEGFEMVKKEVLKVS